MELKRTPFGPRQCQVSVLLHSCFRALLSAKYTSLRSDQMSCSYRFEGTLRWAIVTLRARHIKRARHVRSSKDLYHDACQVMFYFENDFLSAHHNTITNRPWKHRLVLDCVAVSKDLPTNIATLVSIHCIFDIESFVRSLFLVFSSP